MTGDVEFRNVRDTNVGNVFRCKLAMSLIYAIGNFVLVLHSRYTRRNAVSGLMVFKANESGTGQIMYKY